MKRPSQHLPAGRYLLCAEGTLHVPGTKFPAATVATVVVTPRAQPTRRQYAEEWSAAEIVFHDGSAVHFPRDPNEAIFVTRPADASSATASFVPPTDEAQPVAVSGIDMASGPDKTVEADFVDGKIASWREIGPETSAPVTRAAGGVVRRTRPHVVGELPLESSSLQLKVSTAVAVPKATPIDTARLAAAYRTKASTTRAAQAVSKKAPTRRALGTGPCHKCGASGRNGCDHFLPYQGGTV